MGSVVAVDNWVVYVYRRIVGLKKSAELWSRAFSFMFYFLFTGMQEIRLVVTSEESDLC